VGIANPNLHKEAFGASEASHVSLEELKRARCATVWMWMPEALVTVLLAFASHILKPAAGLQAYNPAVDAFASTRGNAGCRAYQRASYGLAIAKMILAGLGFVFNRDQDVVYIHSQCRKTSRVGWIVPHTLKYA
jgi:hypothetical protein